MGNRSTRAGGYSLTNDVENPSQPKKKEGTFVSGWKTIKLIAPYFWPKGHPVYRLRVLLCICILIGSKVLNQFIPLMYQHVVDALPNSFPWVWILLYGLLRFVGGSMGDLRDCIFVQVENYATRIIAIDTFKHVQQLSLGFHLSRNTGALLRTVDRGKAAISNLLNILGFVIMPTILEVILTCGVLFFNFGGWYSLITFVSLSAYVAWTFSITEWRTKFRRAENDRENEASNTALDSLLNFETVKYFTAEQKEVERYDVSLQQYFKATVNTQYSLSLLNVGQAAIIGCGLIGCMLLAGYQVSSGILSLGELVAINAYILQLYQPLNWLGTSYRMIVSAFTDMEKLFELLSENPDVKDIPGASNLRILPGGGEIEFDRVYFTYPSRGSGDKAAGKNTTNSPMLKNVSFKIPAGKTLAIVGHSGSGKTTISRLLCRFYDVASGSITIDGQNISRLTQRSLRRQIGVVPQDTVLFNDTIYYNIAYGKIDNEGESSMSIEEAAKEANIHEFVMSTPDEYQTKVGERGLRLSGGEKQRVAIARTMLKNPAILILDEATSALDSKTEKEIQASLMQVSKGRTTLIVAHRLSTIVNADEIIVLKGGEIIERGTHRSLLEQNGEYKQMWDIQAKQAQEHDGGKEKGAETKGEVLLQL